MEGKTIVALMALAWLAMSMWVIFSSVRRGRKLAAALEAEDSSVYRQLGRPRPSYFPSDRSVRFTQYLSRRDYEKLANRDLAQQFDRYRKSHSLTLGLVLSTMLVVVIAVYMVKQP